MDSLYHLIFSFVGGYVFLRGLNGGYSLRLLFFLSLLSIFIDFDHLIDSLSLHNIFILVPPILLSIYFWLRHRLRLQIYSLTFSIMFYGHLLSDLTYGLGIPLFYPFSTQRFKLPTVVMDPNFVSSFGLTLFLYFGVIYLLVFLLGKKKTS